MLKLLIQMPLSRALRKLSAWPWTTNVRDPGTQGPTWAEWERWAFEKLPSRAGKKSGMLSYSAEKGNFTDVAENGCDDVEVLPAKDHDLGHLKRAILADNWNILELHLLNSTRRWAIAAQKKLLSFHKPFLWLVPPTKLAKRHIEPQGSRKRSIYLFFSSYLT